jgi:hypothetical protein
VLSSIFSLAANIVDSINPFSALFKGLRTVGSLVVANKQAKAADAKSELLRTVTEKVRSGEPVDSSVLASLGIDSNGVAQMRAPDADELMQPMEVNGNAVSSIEDLLAAAAGRNPGMERDPAIDQALQDFATEIRLARTAGQTRADVAVLTLRGRDGEVTVHVMDTRTGQEVTSGVDARVAQLVVEILAAAQEQQRQASLAMRRDSNRRQGAPVGAAPEPAA